MRIARLAVVFAFILTGLALTADAQRTRRPAARATPVPRATPTPAAGPIIAAAKQRVSNQLYNVNVFIDKMGPVAVTIEAADKDAAARRLRPDASAAHEKNKAQMIAAIRGLRAGLVNLETEFRTKPQLTRYLPQIDGLGLLAARAEDEAIAGRFVASKEPLRQVAQKLNDTMAVLPGALPGNAAGARPAGTAVKRNVAIGMTTAQVLNSTWGEPTRKTVAGTSETWFYPGNRSIRFVNGKVTSVVQ